MTSDRSVLEHQIERVELRPFTLEGFHRRYERKQRNRRIRAGVVALVVAAAGAGALARGFSSGPVPASDPNLGVFEPVAGRIVYVNEGMRDPQIPEPRAIDRGYDLGIWAVDPNGPSDTTEGPRVAEDVASTLVRLGLEGAVPLDWSSDGTKLLFKRGSEYSEETQFIPQDYLYILQADGTETRLNREPIDLGGPLPKATISPDGTRVVFFGDGGLHVLDAESGRQVGLLGLPEGYGPTFSPDGMQIAYLVSDYDEEQVWVVNADGSDAHEILANEPTVFGSLSGLEWSPEGGRLAIGLGSGGLAIYTFAPDGSDFRKVITGGISPYWSPDGSQIAYTIPCDEHPSASCPVGSIRRSEFDPQPGESPAGLAIADADGSNVRTFGFAASGPWHPVPADQPTTPSPPPSDGIPRGTGEVLLITGTEAPGDLVAVDPATGEEHVLVEDLDTVYSARWSADGRWVAYETDDGEGGWELWVVSASQEPRLIATGGDPDIFASFGLYWMWSPTGAELATISRSTLSTIDFQTGETTDLGKIVADLLSMNVGPTWAWSPDGTRIAFGAARGGIYKVDVRNGERSLLARLPSEDLPSIDEVMWSSDGAHIAVVNELDDEGRLYVMDADGSNVRVLAEDFDPLGVAWSLDGTRLAFADGSEPDRKVRIWVAPMDGAAPAEIGSLPFAGCVYNYKCDLAWSPDGSQIAFWKLQGDVTAIDADGHGDVEPIDELTYKSWDGGWYSCECT